MANVVAEPTVVRRAWSPHQDRLESRGRAGDTLPLNGMIVSPEEPARLFYPS